MRPGFNLLFFFVLSACLAAACDQRDVSVGGEDRSGAARDASSAPDAGGADAGARDCGPAVPREHAFFRTGESPDGHILPDGTALAPLGAVIKVGHFPLNAIHFPAQDTIVVTNNGREGGDSGGQSLSVIDLSRNEVIQKVEKPGPYSLFLGLARNADGTTLYVSGGADNRIWMFEVDAAGLLSETTPIAAAGFVASLAMAADGKKLFYAGQLTDKVGIVDLTTSPPKVTASVGVGLRSEDLPFAYPYWLVPSKDGRKLYVSNWGESRVSVVDLVESVEAKQVVVGKNPEGMALSPDGRLLFVANSDTDDLSVIDTEKDEVIATVPLNGVAGPPYGSTPTSVDVSPDGERLFVSLAGSNAVAVVSTDGFKVEGMLPAAWYPTRVLLADDGGKMVVVNAKGFGSGPNIEGKYLGGVNAGCVTVFDTAGAVANLERNTMQTLSNEGRIETYFDLSCTGGKAPLPAIKHVFFIIRENKTFDQVLGDMAGVEADPALLEFGERFTPNVHKLAREFAVFDNCYADSEVSVQGHMWLTASTSNDYNEKVWLAANANRAGFPGIEPASYPAAEFFFQHLLRHDVPFVVYGEAVGTLAEVMGLFGRKTRLKGIVDEKWPGGVIWSTEPKDEDRAKYFAARLAEWEANPASMPRFVFMVLPNDHTEGVGPGKKAPESMISDNDYALGLVVESLSASSFWKDSVVFSVEDDPQSGADHVDAHRTVCLAIGPHVKRGYVSRVHYSFPSFYKTIGELLGVPPLTRYDDRAPPILDVFTDAPDVTPYTALPRNIPDEVIAGYSALSPEMRELADETARMDFSEPDSPKNHELGRVLRRYIELKRP